MTGEAQSNIQKFLYNLSMGNYSEADKNLNTVITHKVDTRYDEAIEKIKNSVKQSK